MFIFRIMITTIPKHSKKDIYGLKSILQNSEVITMLYITTPNEPLCFLCVRPTIPHTNSLCPSFIASSLIIIPYTIYIYRAGHLLTCDKLKEKKNMNRRQDDDELNKKKTKQQQYNSMLFAFVINPFLMKGFIRTISPPQTQREYLPLQEEDLCKLLGPEFVTALTVRTTLSCPLTCKRICTGVMYKDCTIVKKCPLVFQKSFKQSSRENGGTAWSLHLGTKVHVSSSFNLPSA